MKKKIQKFPLIYSLAEGILIDELAEKESEKDKRPQSNKCAEQFLGYLKSIQFDRHYDKAKRANEIMDTYYTTDKDKYRTDDYMRNLLQALSFNLTPDQASEVFGKAMNNEVPNKEEKKLGRAVYEEMYKLLNDPEGAME